MYLLDSVMSIGEALNVSITGIVVVFIVLVVLAVLVQLLSKLIRLFVKEPNAKNAKKSDAVKEVVKPQGGVALPENRGDTQPFRRRSPAAEACQRDGQGAGRQCVRVR